MMIGAGIGFIFGIIFTIISAFQFDESRTTAGETIAVGLLVGTPIAVVFGTAAGWLWDAFIKQKT